MGKQVLLLVVSLTLAACASARAEEATREKLELIDRIAKADGTEQYLVALGAGVLEGIKPYADKLPAAASTALYTAMGEQFDGGRLYGAYEVVLMAQILKEELVAVMPWYESAAGKKISELLSQSNSSESVAELKNYQAALANKPPLLARANLVQELDRATQASDLLVDITVNASTGILAGIATAQKKQSHAKEVAMRKQLTELRKNVRPQIRKSTIANFLHTFSAATDGQLRQYIVFLGSRDGHALNAARYFALNEVLKKAAQNVGAAVGAATQTR